MNMQTLETVKRQLQIAVDSMPQLVCLVDGDGRVIRANRTVERWKLGAVEVVRGHYLHDVLHVDCSDPACYLRLFGQLATAASVEDQHAECEAWDAILKRHFVIHTTMPVRAPGQQTASDKFFVVTVDDVTHSGAIEEESGPPVRRASRRAGREVGDRVRTEPAPSRMLSILDRIPDLVAMADRNGALIYLNPAGRALLELESQDPIAGMTLAECHAAGMRERLAKEAIPRAEGSGVWSGDCVLLTRNGREIETFLTLIAHHDSNLEFEGFTLLERDMSASMRTEEALLAAQAQMRRLSAQHMTIQEAERKRIAADLHDGLGQSLSLLKLSIEQVAMSLGAVVSENATRALKQLVAKVKYALAELRRISMNLRPSMLDDLGIVSTLSWFFREFEASGVDTKIEREIRVNETDVPASLKIVIFRILQEATNNAVKHAEAERIKVCLRKSRDALEFTIEDDGIGFDPAGAGNTGAFSKGLGLQSMRERAELSGGSYAMESAPGKGTRIRVRWPLANASTGEGPLRS